MTTTDAVIPAQQGHGQEPGQDFGRVPPQDVEAEQCVLGGMLLSRDAIADVLDSELQPRDYYRPAHQVIHQAILDLYAKGEPVDPITAAAELTRLGELTRVGGPGYLHALVQTVPSAANAEHYAGIVHERAVLRRLVEAGTRITQLAHTGEGSLDDIRDATEAQIVDVFAGRDLRASFAPVRNDIAGFWDGLDARGKGGDVTGIPTGLQDFDSLTGGLQPGHLVVIGARPSVGKSTLALDFARAAAVRYQRPTAFFSLEMPRAELMMRLYSAEARVGLHRIRMGTVTEDDTARLARRTPAIEAAPLYVDDSPALTVMEIRSRARRIAQSHGGLDLLVVDYLQLLQAGRAKRAETRQQEVSEMSRSLKLLAAELGIPVIALSQLNRGSEQRTDKKPQVSDLRESGAIEQDADEVILLHREDTREPESPRAGEADLIVAKHRNGPTATITVAFQGHYSRFVDMASEPDEPN